MNIDPQFLALAQLFDALEDVVAWVKDRDGRYEWVNRAFLVNFSMDERSKHSHIHPSSVRGKTDYDLSPAYLADQFLLDDEHVLAGNRIVNRIELVGQPDGVAIWSLTDKIPLMDSAGSVIGTAGITRPLHGTIQGFGPRTGFEPVLAHIRDHFHEPITNRQLARLAHMSVRAFERKFRASFHITPQRYVRKLQLRIASRALVFTRQSLVDVAIGCGFADQSHFTREFRRQFGRTPREYRDHYAHSDAEGVSDSQP